MKKASVLRLALGLLVAGALWFPSSRARAQEQPGGFAPPSSPAAGFGAVGQWVLTMGFTSGEYLFLHKQSGGGWQIGFRPTADYFLAPNLSVGGVLGIAHDSGGTTDFEIGARGGYNINIVGPWAIWPTAGILARTHSDSAMHNTTTNALLQIFAPFLYHLVPHLFVGLGPSFELGLNGGGNQYGIDALLGGYF